MSREILATLAGFVAAFVVYFCISYFWGSHKDKEGNKSVKLCLLNALITSTVMTVAGWLIFRFIL